MNHLPDLDDELRSILSGSAGALDLELAPAGELARRGARRRRRKRVLSGCAAGTAVVAVLAVAVVGTRGDDSTVATADDVSATTVPDLLPPADSAAAAAGGDSRDGDSAPTITTPPTMPPLDGGTSTAVTTMFDSPADSFVAPWRDGFVRIERTFPSQPLPSALPDELRELFPQEVLDLFPDGLPPTMDEAVQVLSGAGLLEVVTELLDEHPELGEALYAVQPAAPSLRIAVTVDGGDWTPVEFDDVVAGQGSSIEFRVSGDRLLLWSIEPGLATKTVTVSTTADLVDWTTTTFPITEDPTSEPALHRETWVQQIVPSADGWVALVSRDTWVEWERLLPDDVRQEVEDAGEWGMSSDDDGVEVQVGGSEPRRFTWDELGLDGNPEIAGGSQIEFVVADAAGNVSTHPAPDNTWGELISWNDQVVLVGETVQISPDGISWTELSGFPDNSWASGAAPVGDQLLVTGGDFEGNNTGWLVAPDGTVTEVELPELPNAYSLWGGRSSAAWVVELHDETFAEPGAPTEPVTITFEYEGYELTLNELGTGGSIVVTDAATGATIVDRTYSYDDPEIAELYQFDEATGVSSLVITDEDTGDELLRVPGEVLDAAHREAYESSGAAVDEAAAEVVEWNPDFWVVATTNGIDWYTADIADPGPNGPWLGQTAAINGTTLIYPSTEGWHRVDLGG